MKCRKLGLIWVAALFFLVACHEHDIRKETPLSRQTMIVFMPWSSNMKPFFDVNIADLEKAIEEQGLVDDRLFVCIATTPTSCSVMELSVKNGIAVRDTLEVISNPDFTQSADIANLLSSVVEEAPAHHYSLVVGGHGMAWLPVSSDAQRRAAPQYFEYPSIPVTRWFGGVTPNYQIEISTLAEGISSTGLHMDYILFDDCFMSNVEAAYELSYVTDYIIGCPTEIMAYGFPYQLCARYLFGQVDYQQLCQSFYDFYMDYSIPCGTVAVIDCRQLPALADIVRAMNTTYWKPVQMPEPIQRMDGYNPTLFYDLCDVYDHLCPDSALLAEFHEQLSRAVPFKACTPSFYSSIAGFIKIQSFSGITTSETSTNPLATTLSSTAWYRVTH